MRLKVVVLDRDREFIERLSKVFQKKYEDKISLILFSEESSMHNTLKTITSDILLIDHKTVTNIASLSTNIVTAWLCDKLDVNEIDGIPAICKYQSVDNIYKLIVGLYAESSGNIVLKRNKSNTKTIMFTSSQGGSGTSSTAAAYAFSSAGKGKKIFYLNLENLGESDFYFTADGVLSFSDVIYTLKSKNGNLAWRLESVIQTDPSGVDFIHACKNAYDMFELSDQEITCLISGISQVNDYDEIVLDYSGDLSDRMLMLMRDYADKIVYISDGSYTGNRKFEKFCEVVHVLEQRNEWNILGKMSLLYNRYSSKTGTQMEKTAVPVIGGIHRFEGIAEKELIQAIANVDVIDRI